MTTSPAIGARKRQRPLWRSSYTRRGSGASPVALAGEHSSRGIGPRTDARLGRGTSHAQQTGPGVGPYYRGHALSRPTQLGSTAEGRRASVARSLWYEIACGVTALAGLLAWCAVALAWRG